MIRFALPVLLLLGGCSDWLDLGPRPTASVRTATGPDADLILACRRQAEREIVYNDRGQWARDDEALALSDMTNNIPSMRIRASEGTRVMRRDQLVEQCIRQNRGGPPVVNAPPAATTTRASRR